MTKLTADDVRQIKALLASGVSKAEISRRLGVGRSLVTHIAFGRTWKEVA